MTSSGIAASAASDPCQSLTEASGSNFAYAFRFLPKSQRQGLYAIYAFCRVTDDLVDEAVPPTRDGGGEVAGTPMERLKAWRAELDACFRGEASHPVTLRLAETIQAFRIPHAYFEELLNGVEMDILKSRYATFAELQQYCYRVAGVVGLMCIQVFGCSRPESRTYAEHLGTAFQLTNILRDLGSDADRGRVYLPQEDLRRFGYMEADLFDRRVTPAFHALMRFEVARAREFYAAARAAMPLEDRPALLPAEIMTAIYRRLLMRIEAADYDVFSRRIRLSDPYRLVLALLCWARHRLLAC
ncbi:MAG TPA: presqualene diphosphate synthase HpnD [Candidatus Methylomirabilis sp.]|nr:presqualene diphosphate synthase HpnD [Candidatus Methylomirabilis sp.]